MNKKVVAVIVVILAAVAIWYGYNQMKPYMAAPAPEEPIEAVEPEGAN